MLLSKRDAPDRAAQERAAQERAEYAARVAALENNVRQLEASLGDKAEVRAHRAVIMMDLVCMQAGFVACMLHAATASQPPKPPTHPSNHPPTPQELQIALRLQNQYKQRARAAAAAAAEREADGAAAREDGRAAATAAAEEELELMHQELARVRTRAAVEADVAMRDLAEARGKLAAAAEER